MATMRNNSIEEAGCQNFLESFWWLYNLFIIIAYWNTWKQGGVSLIRNGVSNFRDAVFASRKMTSNHRLSSFFASYASQTWWGITEKKDLGLQTEHSLFRQLALSTAFFPGSSIKRDYFRYIFFYNVNITFAFCLSVEMVEKFLWVIDY